MNKKSQARLIYGFIFGVILISIFSLYFIGAESFNENNTKLDLIFGENISKYGKIEIKNKLNDIITSLELKENTDVCGTRCSAETEIIMFKDGVLIDDVRFMELQNDKSEIQKPITNYHFYIKTGDKETGKIINDYDWVCTLKETENKSEYNDCENIIIGTHNETIPIWKEYKLGTEVKAGTYYIKLEGEKDFYSAVDWQITSQGIIIDDWADWGAGGTITYDGNYVIHTFLTNGTFTVGSEGNITILLVAGGGSGGGGDNIHVTDAGGGGGAGGYIYNNSYIIQAGTYNVTVGSGGAMTTINAAGLNGTNSVFGNLIAIGGGAGGWYNTLGQKGGSGGGSAITAGGLGTSGQGNNGGYGNYMVGASAGGGGGASTAGADANIIAYDVAGDGGNGTANNINGTSIYYAGGGGGGAGTWAGGIGGTGGLGGGGKGGGNNGATTNGTNGLGGGGGGGTAGPAGVGGAGGSGIVIIRYSVDSIAPNTTTPILNSTDGTNRSNQDLNCYATLTDNQQTNLTAYWKWYKNNATHSAGTKTKIQNGTNTLITTLDSGNISKGEQWICEIIPNDGIQNGTAINSSFIIILNTIPTHNSPLLKTPTKKNLSTEDLICYNQSTSDADNDVVTNIYNWYKNNQPLTVLNMPFEINADDYSGYDNDGEINSTPTFIIGKYGRALEFDGVDDYIFIQDSDSLDFINKKTWQLWFKRNFIGEETLFDKSSEGKSNYKLEFLSNNKLKFSYSLALGLANYLWQVKTNQNFDEGTYTQTYYNTTENAVVLDGSHYNGNYTSRVFNNSEKTLTFNSLSWSADTPTSAELSPEENMVGLWHFNEGSGSITDDVTANNNDGTIYGATWTSQGKFNNALDFDGSNDYINFGNTNNFERTDSFSYSFWIKTNSTTNYITIMSKTPYGSWHGMETFVFNGKIRFYLIGTGEQLDVSSTSDINTGTWKYVVITYNGNSNASGVKIYVDGVESSSGTGTLTTSIVNSNNFQVSCRAGAYNCFYGIIDEVAIWNRALSVEEIQEHYNKGLGILTNLSLSIRSCDDPNCNGEDWQITDITSSPYDISSLSDNKYFQFKSEFETNDTDYSPKLYNVTLNYSKQVTETEANITSITAITDTNWHLVTVTYNTNNNLSLYLDNFLEASKIETSLPYYKDNNLTIAKFFNGNIDEFRIYDYALSQEQVANNYLLKYNTIVSQETSGGDNWMCQVTPNDGEADGVTLNSTSLEVLWAITFNVTSGEDGSQITSLDNIICNNSWSGGSVSSPFEFGFLPGSYECTFVETWPFEYFNKTIIFTADNDKKIDIIMSKKAYLTIEEHTWLEWLYNCWHNGDCWDLLSRINQTTTQIWQRLTGTDTSVTTQEKVLSYTLNTSSNITINYTIELPYKEGVAVNELLPIRLYFWFTDTERTQCYSQDKGTNTNRAEAPYCLPLVAEVLGPNDGTVNFQVDLRPNLPTGTYNFTRSIEIDPLGVWTQYGREDIGQIEITETGDGSIDVSGENRINKPISLGPDNSNSGGSSSEGGTTTIIKEREIIKLIPEEKPKDDGEIISLNKPITGATIGASLLSRNNLMFIVTILCITFIIFLVVTSRTILKLKIKNKLINLFLLFIILIFLDTISGQISLNRDSSWSANLTGVFHSSLAFGDIDNDDDYDMVAIGCITGGVDTCTTADKIRVYINNGTSLVEDLIWEQNLTNLGYGSLAFGDIDNDGDLDLIALGDRGGGSGDIQIYINNGTTLTENQIWEQNLSDVDAYAGSLAFGDVNNDGDLDLALVGAYPSSDNGVYINNGTSFIKNNNWLANLPLVGHGLGMGALAFGDIDNDGDLDLLFSGSYSTNFYDDIYRNNETSLVGSLIGCDPCGLLGWPSITLGDYDNDADLDLAYMGTKTGDWFYIYNNSNGSFTQAQAIGSFFDGSSAFGDYDNDGDLDIGAMGKETGRNIILNNNHASFSPDVIAQVDMKSDNMQQGSLAWCDLNNDNNLDLAINGKQGDSSTFLSKVYISNTSLTKNNTLPLPPNSSFSSNYVNNVLTLSWGNGSDTETNTSGLYYNLRIGNATNNNSIVSGVFGGSSNPTAGYFGNMMQRKSISLNVQLEANKTYYWYVQTIDTGLAKSNWSAVQSFNTSLDTTKPEITINYPSPNASLHTSNPYFIFNVTVTDANLTNVTLYSDWTGSMIANETNSSGINTTYVFTKNLTGYNDGQYSWYIYACDGNSNCQTSETRSFYLDRAYPVINLISPADTETWTSSSTVTFSYNVSDIDIANCSLIVDNSIVNTSTSVSEDVSQSFTYTLSNGVYSWYINCTDYVGYTNNSANRSLTVSYTAPCTNCGGGSGGGGGSTTTKNITTQPKKFDIDFSKTMNGSFEAKQGDIKIFSFNGEVLHEIVISEIIKDSVRLIIKSEPIVLLIKSGETKQIDINKDNINDFEIKLVSIMNGKANFSLKKLAGADIVGKEELEEAIRKEALFDVKVTVLDKFKEVFPGEEVSAKIEVFNINNIGQVDVVVDYYLSDNESIFGSGGFDTLSVEAVASFVRSLIIPEDIKAGIYYFNVNVSYKNFTTSGKAEFKVKSKKLIFIEKKWKEIVIIGIGAIALIAIVLFVYLRMIKKKEEKIEKKESKLEKKEEKLEKIIRKLRRKKK